jgi:hypothetical protein
MLVLYIDNYILKGYIEIIIDSYGYIYIGGIILLFLKYYWLELLAVLLAFLSTIVSFSAWRPSFFPPNSQVLIIIGLFLNLFGAFKVYKSVKPYPVYYAYSGKDKEALPVATLNIVIAKKGLSYIITGIIFQVISVIFVIFNN